MEKSEKKKLYSLISFLLSTAIFVLALFVFISSITARARNGRAEFFGYSFAVVVTDSMAPEIKAGDLIIVKSCDITDISEGDNAVFLGLSGTYEGKSIVHRVVGIYDVFDDDGTKTGICLETFGINNAKHDDDYVYADNFIGKEVFHSTFLGAIMTFLRNPINWVFIVVFIVAVSIAVRQLKKVVKIAKNQGEGSVNTDGCKKAVSIDEQNIDVNEQETPVPIDEQKINTDEQGNTIESE